MPFLHVVCATFKAFTFLLHGLPLIMFLSTMISKTFLKQAVEVQTASTTTASE